MKDLAELPAALAQPARFAIIVGLRRELPVRRRRAVMESALRERPGDLALLMGLANSYVGDQWGTTAEPQGDSEQLRWLQAAVAAHPRNAAARNNLGRVLHDREDFEGALWYFEEATRIDPTLALGYYNMGVVYAKLRQPKRAIASYLEAIRLNPNDADARHNLADVLLGEGEPAAAIPYLLSAIQIEGPVAKHHYALGLARQRTGDIAGAVAACRTAIDLKPDYAEAHCNLGLFLQELGQFAEAVGFLRTGHELGRRQPGWSYASDCWVHEAERLLALDARLPHVLAGEAAGPQEQLDLADLCMRYKVRYADAALLYGSAFGAGPCAAEELDRHRYSAVRAAALAASGRGVGAETLGSSDRARLRGLALDWLRAELAAYGDLPAGDPAVAGRVQKSLGHWLDDPDLAGVRDAQGLAALPAEERERWTKLWNDVRVLMARAAAK